MINKNFYYVFFENNYHKLSLRELVKYKNQQEIPPKIWSARISTGLLGLTSCKAGNRGPKDYDEVLLAVGDEGLKKLINLGFITCPVCHPENTKDFWETIRKDVKDKYAIDSLDDFVNKEVLPFDARRVDWEEIMPVIKKTPNRIYLPKGLSDNELLSFKIRFDDLGMKLSPIGYYNPDVPGRFTEYKLPVS